MKNIKLLLEYDIERPYGKIAETEEGRQLRRRFLYFDRFLNQTLDKLVVPRTFFIIGHYLDRCLDDFSREQLGAIYDSSNQLIEIQQHTYSHSFLVKPIKGEDKPIVSAHEFAQDLEAANAAIGRILGVRPIGLSMPYGYEGDLSDVPEFLKILSMFNFRYVISDTRCENKKSNLERQPHSYKIAGFPEIVEIPSHGEDVLFCREKALRFLGREPDAKEKILQHYQDLFGAATRLAEKKSLLYISLCFHPWAMAEYDPELKIHKRIIAMARKCEMQIMHFIEVADKIIAKGE